MNTQNILKYYGSKLDVILDHSEYYDLELVGVDDDYDANLLDLTTGGTINYSSLIYDSDCVTGLLMPVIFDIDRDTPYQYGDCDPFTIRRRTENGWTIDIVVNKNSHDWSSGKNLFYIGINSDDEPQHYLDNNLSFSFTSDGELQWKSYRYSGYCDTVSGYTETNYIYSGKTEQLFDEPHNSNVDLIFNITVVFDRYNEYVGCDLANEGGWNDLITGVTINNPTDILTGATEDISYIEVLNEKWWNERNKRLGVLSIYINGKIIYKINDFEEIIPSERNFENKANLSFGAGVLYGGNIHYFDDTSFYFDRIRYYEEPLNAIRVNHNYKTSIEPYYDITETNEICVVGSTNGLFAYTENGLLTENEENLLTEDNNILLY